MDVLPRKTPLSGGQTVTILGVNLAYANAAGMFEPAWCRFGDQIVLATIISSREVKFIAPARTMPERRRQG
jgi:hypothetical protein